MYETDENHLLTYTGLRKLQKDANRSILEDNQSPVIIQSTIESIHNGLRQFIQLNLHVSNIMMYCKVPHGVDLILERNDSDTMHRLCNFTVPEFNEIFSLVKFKLPPTKTMSAKNALFLTLCYFKIGKFTLLQEIIGCSAYVVGNTIRYVLRTITDLLYSHFVRWYTLDELKEQNNLFMYFPNAIAAVDVTVHPISRPKDEDFKKSQIYWDGKAEKYTYKSSYCVAPNGLAVSACFLVNGSVHDLNSLFVPWNTFTNEYLTQCHIQQSNHPGSPHPQILGDSGYQGVVSIIENFVHPFKETVAFKPSSRDKDFNYLVSKDRIIVEDYFGRSKTDFEAFWKHPIKTGDIDFNIKCFKFVTAITNFLILKHPLRKRQPGKPLKEFGHLPSTVEDRVLFATQHTLVFKEFYLSINQRNQPKKKKQEKSRQKKTGLIRNLRSGPKSVPDSMFS